MNAILEVPSLAVNVQNLGQAAATAQDLDEDLTFSEGASERASGGSSDDLQGNRAAVSIPRRDAVNPPRTHGQETSRTSPHDEGAYSQIPQPPRHALGIEFDDLYRTYERRVYRQCYRMLGNQEDAEDLTQEVFLQLFRKADTFRGESSFSTWLHRLTINTVLMQVRRYRRWRTPLTSLDAVPNADDGANEFPAAVCALPAATTNPLDKISLEVAISQLSCGYKEIFLLHDQEGYRHDEIAALLGISEGTSKSQLHKARLRLRDLVEFGEPANHHRSHRALSQ